MGNERKLNIKKCSRKEVLETLRRDPADWEKFCSFPPAYQEEIMLFCMGKQGIRITYDAIFKRLFSPVIHRERLEDFISSVLGKKVTIVRVLQHEGTQLVEKGSFVIMDVVVQLEDGTLINVEMQKIGYRFTVERTDCYMADLLMRQYNEIKKEKGKKFHFKDLSKVISIIIMEKSPGIFHNASGCYIHRGKMEYDSGIVLDDLFENTYICLDTYKKFIHTEIRDIKEAWMLFLSSNSMEDICEVCSHYPQFIPLYQEAFDFGKDVKGLLQTFSEELREMDRNEERYMVEELQKEMKQQKEQLQRELQELKIRGQQQLQEEKARGQKRLQEEKARGQERLQEEKARGQERLQEEKQRGQKELEKITRQQQQELQAAYAEIARLKESQREN